MKAILSVPDEGYSERHLMKAILSVPDEGYSKYPSCALNSISTFLFLFKGICSLKLNYHSLQFQDHSKVLEAH